MLDAQEETRVRRRRRPG